MPVIRGCVFFWAGSTTFFIISIIISSINPIFSLTPATLLIYDIATTSLLHIGQTQFLKHKIKKLTFELEKEKRAKKTLKQNVKTENLLNSKNNNLIKKQNKYLDKNRFLNQKFIIQNLKEKF